MYSADVRAAALKLLGESETTLSEVSRRTGVSRSTLREWATQGGAFADSTRRRATCPSSAALDGEAYAHLLGLYLGDGCVSVQRTGVFSLRVTCDARYPRLIEECEASMTAVLANCVSRTTKVGCVDVTSYSKHWPCLFPQHGPGRKHQRPIVLQPWQREIVERHPGRFLRGLFHSDGCRVTNWTEKMVAGERRRYEYPRYFFTNYSTDILQLCEWALDLVGAEHRRSNRVTVSVAKRASVALLDTVVGPKS